MSGTRPPSYADKRSSNASATDRATSRPRMSAPDGGGGGSTPGVSANANSSFRSSDARAEYASRRQQQQQQASASSAQNRSTSNNANARATGRTVDERRTERVQVTTRETLITRTKSPERRGAAASEKSRGSYERLRPQQPVEPRSREQRTEAPTPGKWALYTPAKPVTLQ